MKAVLKAGPAQISSWIGRRGVHPSKNLSCTGHRKEDEDCSCRQQALPQRTQSYLQATCLMVQSFGARASGPATHLLRSKWQRDIGTPTSLPSWKPAFQFPAQPASKLEAPQVHFQSQEEEQTALLRSDIAKPSSDSFSISEAIAHSRLCHSLLPLPNIS